MRKIFYSIEEFCVLFWYDLCSYFEAIYDEIRLKASTRLANAKQRAYNKRYYVIADYQNKLTVINKEDIKWLKRAHLINKNVTHLEIMRDCLYYTSLKDNEAGSKLTLEERIKRKDKWLSYMENYRQEKNFKKLERLKAKHNGK